MAFPKGTDIEIPLLQVLIASGGRATLKEAVERVTTYFPQLTREDLILKQPSGKDLKWRNMVAWARNRLRERGEIDGTVSGVWVITELGRRVVTEATRGGTAALPSALVSLLPPLSQIQAGGPTQTSMLTQAERSTVARTVTQTRRRKQPAVTSVEVGQQTVIEATDEEIGLRLPLGVLLPSSVAPSSGVVTLVDPLHHRLRTTAQSGVDATAFEEALAEAFRVLGFDAIKIGGRGDTDIRVTAPLGKHQYIAIVDAKSSRTGKVADTAIHIPSLHDHREKHQAEYVMVVAPMFMRGNAIAHAEREQVVLMEIESLIAILEMYRHTPLSLYTLREMFIRPGLYGTALDPVREAHEQVDLLTALGPLIVQTIEQWYARGHVEAVNADALFYAFIERFQRVRYPRELIDAALMYLASPFIGALRKNDVGYYLTMPARTVRHRLLRLGESFQQVPAGVSTRREVQADDKRGIQQLE